MLKKCLFVTTFALAACHGRPVVSTPPPALLSCADAPEPPSLPERDGTDATQLVRDQMTLNAYLALLTAHGDCAAKIKAIRAWSEGMR